MLVSLCVGISFPQDAKRDIKYSCDLQVHQSLHLPHPSMSRFLLVLHIFVIICCSMIYKLHVFLCASMFCYLQMCLSRDSNICYVYVGCLCSILLKQAEMDHCELCQEQHPPLQESCKGQSLHVAADMLGKLISVCFFFSHLNLHT